MKIHFIPDYALALYIDGELACVITPPTGAHSKDANGYWDDDGLVKRIIEYRIVEDIRAGIPDEIDLESRYFIPFEVIGITGNVFEIELKPVLIY